MGASPISLRSPHFPLCTPVLQGQEPGDRDFPLGPLGTRQGLRTMVWLLPSGTGLGCSPPFQLAGSAHFLHENEELGTQLVQMLVPGGAPSAEKKPGLGRGPPAEPRWANTAHGAPHILPKWQH